MAAAELPFLPSHRLRPHSPAEDSHLHPAGRCPAAAGVEQEPRAEDGVCQPGSRSAWT